MEITTNQNAKMFFSPELSRAVSELLKKYNLQEPSEDFWEKLENNKKTNGQIIISETENFIAGKTKKQIAKSLEGLLNLSAGIAEKITDDIEKETAPIIVKFQPQEEPEEQPEEESEFLTKLKPPIGLSAGQSIHDIDEKNLEEQDENKKILPEKKEENPPDKKQSDSYREQI